ncbi:MAG: DUF1232 domain-containing protein [Armatimonadetes bacterium]|nr:DUF1232 domain-containing protein [Armatimonadota bacterium]
MQQLSTRPRNPWTALLPLVFSLVYGVSPIDLIPDIIPLLGWADDGVVAIAMLILSLSLLVRRTRQPNRLPR